MRALERACSCCYCALVRRGTARNAKHWRRNTRRKMGVKTAKAGSMSRSATRAPQCVFFCRLAEVRTVRAHAARQRVMRSSGGAERLARMLDVYILQTEHMLPHGATVSSNSAMSAWCKQRLDVMMRHTPSAYVLTCALCASLALASGM